ncbi:hypothetical protein ABG067_006081 [Albugo candida]
MHSDDDESKCVNTSPVVLIDQEVVETLQNCHINSTANTSDKNGTNSSPDDNSDEYGTQESFTQQRRSDSEISSTEDENDLRSENESTSAIRDPYISISEMSCASSRTAHSFHSMSSLSDVGMFVIDESRPFTSESASFSSGTCSGSRSFSRSKEPQTDFRARRNEDQWQQSSSFDSTEHAFDLHGDLESTKRGNGRSDFWLELESKRKNSGSDSQSGNQQPTDRSDALRISMLSVLASIFLGIAFGLLLILFEVDPLLLQWVALPGNLFYRALKCIIVPYIFCAVAVAMGDISFAGRVSALGLETAKIFALIWFVSTSIGMLVALGFRYHFRDIGTAISTSTNAVALLCHDKKVFQMNGTRLECSSTEDETLIAEIGEGVRSVVLGSSPSTFVFHDLNDYFRKTPGSQIRLQNQLLDQALHFTSSNIVKSMYKMELLGVITFASLLGVIAGQQYYAKTRKVNYLYATLLQLRNAYFWAIEVIISLTPGAMISFIAGLLAQNQDMFQYKRIAYLYMVAILSAIVLQMFIALPLLVLVFTRRNPYEHMRYMLHAYLFAFAVSSSLATTPVTLSCMKKSRVCTTAIANFVISFGTVANLSAAGLLIPIATIFLAETAGLGTDLTIFKMVALVLISWFGCIGTAPIPNGHVVLFSTAYTAIMGVRELPSTYALMLVVDFFIDRILTVVNVNDDAMALKIIAETIDETVIQELAGQRC